MNARRIARIAAATTTLAAGPAAANFVTHTLTLPDSVVQGANLDSGTLSVASDFGKPIVSVKAVGLQASDGEFVRCKSGGGGAVYADQPDIATHEMLLMLTFSDGTVAFKARNSNYYLQANNGGGQGASCQSSGAGAYARWTAYEQADGTFAFKSSGNRYLGIESDDDMIVTATTIGSTNKWTIVDLGAAGMNAQPEVRIQFHDIDGDGSEEMLLMMTLEDGQGYLMTDPMGIADTMAQLGYRQGHNNQFWDSLSTTQRTALRNQANAVGSFGSVISGAEIRHVINRFDDSEDRTYNAYNFSVVVDETLYESGQCNGDQCNHLTIGEFSLSFDSDGLEVNAALLTATSSQGPITTETTIVSGGLANKVTDNSITMGAQASLLSVSVTVGNTNGSYAGVSASVGEGFWLDAAAGRNDQYGFTLDIPVIPVGVSVYVKGADVVWLWDESADFFKNGAVEVADLAQNAWNSHVGWAAQAGENIALAVTNTADSSMATLQVTGDNVVAALSDGADQVLKIYEDAAGAVESTVQDFTNAAEDMFNGVSGAVEDLGSAIGNAAGDVGDFFCGLLGC